MKEQFSLTMACDQNDKGNIDGLRAYLDHHVRQDQFVQNEKNEWAYRKVLSHLDEGYKCVAQCSVLREEHAAVSISIDDVGYAVNPLIRGRRPWDVGNGAWPTALDLAAYVYFAAFETAHVDVTAGS